MIAPRPLGEGFAVTGQVQLSELPEIARHFRTLINNRPDCEEAGQPSSAELEAAARQLGLDYQHIPVVPGAIDDEQVSDFSDALAEKTLPILAFCRTGTRSASLWALSQASKQPPADTLRAAAQVGYDLGSLEPRIVARAK